MITYELAKQLKDVGFPQKGVGVFRRADGEWHDDGTKNPKWEEDKDKYAYAPTLSELIEACGEGFDVLSRDTSEGKDKVVWLVNNYISPESIIDNMAWIEGSTPEEAVANLWFELNKK